VACMVDDLVKGSEPRNRMREIFTYGTVGGAPGNRCFYPDADKPQIFQLYKRHLSEEMAVFVILIEIIAAIVTAVLAFMWVRDPAGNYEPWTVICGVVFAVTEICRRIRTPSKVEPESLSKSEELIRWIQSYGHEKPLSQVLPRALQLSQLLSLSDFEHWVRMELLGYTQEGGMTEQDTVPEYREITGRYMDNYNRMLQVQTDNDFVNGYRFRYGVRQLEEFAKKEKMQNIRDEGFIEILRRELNVDVCRFCFSPTEIVGVLDRIRNHLIEKINNIKLNVD
ncbi:MAG: hypothetical protein PF574_04820, partial [Candidatus Delongbacteria bacterium]|nr:hypothetical protein [Candidatus Delongbacteria bacterium]